MKHLKTFGVTKCIIEIIKENPSLGTNINAKHYYKVSNHNIVNEVAKHKAKGSLSIKYINAIVFNVSTHSHQVILSLAPYT
jgi:hypothetical protein